MSGCQLCPPGLTWVGVPAAGTAVQHRADGSWVGGLQQHDDHSFAVGIHKVLALADDTVGQHVAHLLDVVHQLLLPGENRQEGNLPKLLAAPFSPWPRFPKRSRWAHLRHVVLQEALGRPHGELAHLAQRRGPLLILFGQGSGMRNTSPLEPPPSSHPAITPRPGPEIFPTF